jgi:hypothetical protein
VKCYDEASIGREVIDMPLQQPPGQEGARVVLIIILLFILWTQPDQGPPPGFPSVHDYAAERIARSRHSLDVLNITKWQDFSPKGGHKPAGEPARYLNLTGFREEDGYAWDRLDAFKKRSLEYTQDAKGRYRQGNDNGLVGDVYENVTGIVTGKWVRHVTDLNGDPKKRFMNLTEISPGIEWAWRDEEYWTRNITGIEGKLTIRVDERNVEEIDTSLDEAEDEKTPLPSVNLIREVQATVTVQDESSSGDGHEMKVHGVHWPKQGVMLMTTTSEKFSGIFGLPHLAINMEQYASSQKLLNKTLETTIELMEKASWADQGNPWTSSPDAQGDAIMPVPHCEYMIYIQTYPLKVDLSHNAGRLDPANIVHQIEQELRYPNGAPVPEIPKLQMSAVIFSPDCGFMLESKGPPAFAPSDGEHLVGKKQEILLQDIQSWLHAFAAVVFGQILLLKVQSKEASTPSTVGRVSLYTIAMMLMADALLFSSLSLLSATAPNLFPSALLTSFAALMSVALGVRFIGAVYNVQEPERREALRLQQAAQVANTPPRPNAASSASGPPTANSANQTPTPIITAAGADTLPLPVTTSGGRHIDIPIIIPSDQDVDAEIAEFTRATGTLPLLPTTNRPAEPAAQPRASSSFGTIYIKFVLTLTILLFFSLSAISWPVTARTAYVNILAFVYLSFWLPQIHRNVIRNCRKALLWKFIIGQSVLRISPFAYFYLKEDNILFAQTDWKAFCVLAGWVWIQIWVLVFQEVLGPRWGLPKSWTTEGWDYHPILREDAVEEGGLPIGLVQIPGSPKVERSGTGTSEDLGGRKKNDNGIRSVDCAICMQVLEVPIVPIGEDASKSNAAGGVTGMLARRQYMVTPCRHVFHSTCLEGWMRFRLQCPICRENLPPL